MSISHRERIVIKPYLAAFLLPTPVTKCLTAIGWEFESAGRLPEDLIVALQGVFDIHATKTYLGMDVFEGNGLKLTASRDAEGRIESIFVQLRDRRPDELRIALAAAGFNKVEVFVPEAQGAARL
jgi:hypothetical protein